jgi:hypothetical protein
VSQNSHKKQKNEQEEENLCNPNRRDSHMNKTQYHSKQSHNENSNEPEQAVPPKVELLKNTLNGGIQSRRKIMRNSIARQEEMQETCTFAPFR